MHVVLGWRQGGVTWRQAEQILKHLGVFGPFKIVPVAFFLATDEVGDGRIRKGPWVTLAEGGQELVRAIECVSSVHRCWEKLQRESKVTTLIIIGKCQRLLMAAFLPSGKDLPHFRILVTTSSQ